MLFEFLFYSPAMTAATTAALLVLGAVSTLLDSPIVRTVHDAAMLVIAVICAYLHSQGGAAATLASYLLQAHHQDISAVFSLPRITHLASMAGAGVATGIILAVSGVLAEPWWTQPWTWIATCAACAAMLYLAQGLVAEGALGTWADWVACVGELTISSTARAARRHKQARLQRPCSVRELFP